MLKKGAALVVGLALLGAVLYFFLSPRKAENSPTATASALDVIPVAVPAETPGPAPKASPMTEAIEKKEDVAPQKIVLGENQALFSHDGHEEIITLAKLEDAKRTLDWHDNQNPADEFEAMRPIELNGADGNFSGDYSDSKHSFEISLRYSPPSYGINAYSCFYTKESGLLKVANETLGIRGNGRGYAMVRLGENRYMRMAAAMGELDKDEVMYPIVYARIFTKVDLDWKMTREVRADTVPEVVPQNRYCDAKLLL